jgi:hypothetical protein
MNMSVPGIEKYKEEMRAFAVWFYGFKRNKKSSVEQILKILSPSDLQKLESWKIKFKDIVKEYNLTKEETNLAILQLQFESRLDPI